MPSKMCVKKGNHKIMAFCWALIFIICKLGEFVPLFNFQCLRTFGHSISADQVAQFLLILRNECYWISKDNSLELIELSSINYMFNSP
jgi:hypothetical protein